MVNEHWNWRERIHSDPRILGGRPVIRGTRVPVEVILGALAGGDSFEGVCEGWTISDEDVRAALAYATHLVHVDRVPALPV